MNRQDDTLHGAAEGFAAAGSVARLGLLRLLVRAGHDGLSIGALQRRAALPASTLAHHLRHLRDAGLVEQQRVGRSVVNRACYPRIRALADYLLAECCVDADAAPPERPGRPTREPGEQACDA